MSIIRFVCAVILIQTLCTSSIQAQAQGTLERQKQQQRKNQAAQEKTAGDQSALRLSSLFGNHMVLQQQTDAPIWGTAQPGANVSVSCSWNKAAAQTQADQNGKWMTTVATPAAGGPFKVVVKSGAESVTLKDVLAGEVWICSGQSNMQWKMRGFGPKHFADAVAKAKQPQIRYCGVQQALALKPQDDVQAKWTVCSPKAVLNFSAVAYFFANRLERELDVPIGLISTNWGGSPAEAWVKETVIASDFPEFNKTLKQYPAFIEKFGAVHPRSPKMPKGIKFGHPSVLYNQMIHPLIPFSIRGVIWYQGESNVKNPDQYRELFPALIRSWRDEWSQGEFPFYFVQIAPFKYKTNPLPVALLREAQFQSLEVPNTAMAVTMDIGNTDNIHPKQKQPVGERLALIALAKDYGRKDLVYSGPLYSGHKVQSGKIRLSFQHTGGGLASRDQSALSHFTIAGRDRTFVAADAVIDGDSIVVSSDQVRQPIAVRFAWGNADSPNLMNREGLPASSFRTDDWPIKPKGK